jgi:hypothetical protein
MSRLALVLVAIAVSFSLMLPTPALATRAKGEPSNGYYWLLDDAGRWQCRSLSSGKIQPHQKCIDAGAVKPNSR